MAVSVKKGEITLDSKEYKNKLKKIWGSFAWSILGYFDEAPKTIEIYDHEVKAALEKNPKDTLKKIHNRISDNQSEREKLKKSVDKKGKFIIETASYATYLKDYYKSSVNGLQFIGEPLFKELARQSGLSVAFIKDLAPEEIFDLARGKFPDRKIVLDRAKRNIVIAVPGKIKVLIGDDADIFSKHFLKRKEEKDKTEFKGRVASKGYGKGRAKIVLELKDFSKLNEGDVLIVTNTSPDFVTIMKKASAIVAEEGGLTAHVSVVSREFGIPCIVGISHVTEAIKDDDLVEVNANEGVVKVIKSTVRV